MPAKSYWDLLGGYVAPGESPRAAAVRAEELGLKIELGALLSVDWAPHDVEGDKLLFVFDGMTLTSEQFASIRYMDGEVTERRSSTPSTSVGPAGGSGNDRTRRSNVSRPTVTPTAAASRTPARPASSNPIEASTLF